MSLNIDELGTIYIHQGDSGDVIVQGLPNDKDYRIFFAVRDDKRNLIGDELVVNSNFSDSVTFSLRPELTDLFSVPEDESYSVYYYGLKLCSGDIEDTLFISGSGYGQLNHIIVYPKRVEGFYE